VLFKKLDLLPEDDFAYFRTSFESGRQVPNNLKKGLYFGILIHLILIYFSGYSLYDPPESLDSVMKVFFITTTIITFALIIISFIYTIPAVYQKKQHVQYLVGNLSILNIGGIFMYSIAFYLIKTETNITEKYLLTLICLGTFLLLIFLMSILIRLYRHLLAGDYRSDSETNNYKKALEKEKKTLSRLPESIIALTGLILITQSLLQNYVNMNTETIVMIVIFLLIPYVTVYSFSHALITYYCKKRFASFNFDEDGNLYPLGSGDRVRDKEELA